MKKPIGRKTKAKKKAQAPSRSGKSKSKPKLASKKSKKLAEDFGSLRILNLDKPLEVYGCIVNGDCSAATSGTCVTVSSGCYTC